MVIKTIMMYVFVGWDLSAVIVVQDKLAAVTALKQNPVPCTMHQSCVESISCADLISVRYEVCTAVCVRVKLFFISRPLYCTRRSSLVVF